MEENCPYTIRLTPHIVCSILKSGNEMVKTGKQRVEISTPINRKRGIFYMIFLEPVLFVDEQQQPKWDLCDICGGVRYAPGYSCLRCERRGL